MDRRAEIEAKRARLEEMRRRREEKEKLKTPIPKNEWKSVTAVMARIPRTLLYTKSTQTEAQPLPQQLKSQPEPVQQEPIAEEIPIETLKVEEEAQIHNPFTISTHYDPDAVGLFLQDAFKVMERQQNVLIKYHQPAHKTHIPQTIQQIYQLPGPHTVTAIDWSPHHENLIACSYGNSNSILSPGGSCVLVWSLDFPTNPEYTLKAPTDITHLKFSPANPALVYGAGYNGQVYVWDLRKGREILPTVRSVADGSGHLLPICTLEVAPFINHDVLVSFSVDGAVCMWSNDRLAHPQAKISLTVPGKTQTLASTCACLSHNDSSLMLVGTLDGTIYTGRRVDSVGAKAGIVEVPIYTGHSAPVTALAFHPQRDDFVFLSASLDWSIRIWSKSSSIEIQFPDAVTSAAWSPHHSACFVCCFRNTVQVWNLASSTEESVAEYELKDLVTAVLWDPYQKTRLVCSGKGVTVVLDLSTDILEGVYGFD